jgi:hypothetical protein
MKFHEYKTTEQRDIYSVIDLSFLTEKGTYWYIKNPIFINCPFLIHDLTQQKPFTTTLLQCDSMEKMGYEFGVPHAAHPMGMCCCPSACESVSAVILVNASSCTLKLVTLLEENHHATSRKVVDSSPNKVDFFRFT